VEVVIIIEWVGLKTLSQGRMDRRACSQGRSNMDTRAGRLIRGQCGQGIEWEGWVKHWVRQGYGRRVRQQG
jgi:hypothetical protein